MKNQRDGLPSFGGAGQHFGYDQQGREVRSFRAGDSIFRYEADRRGFSDFWTEVDAPFGKWLRAKAVGPSDAWERRAISSTAGGGDLIPDPIRFQVLDDLKAQSVLGRAGAQFVPMGSGSLAITRVDNPATHSWTAEGSTTSGTTDPNFTSVTLQSKTLRAIHQANRELVADSPGFGEALDSELIGALRAELQRATFVGSTSNGAPKGLYNSTGDGVKKLDFGGSTAGVVPAGSSAGYEEILRAREELLNSNVADEDHSYVWSPRTDKQFNSLAATDNQPLQLPPVLRDVQRLVTTSVPSTLGPGSLTKQSAIFYGRYPHLVVGMRMDPSIEVMTERYAENFRLGFLSFLRADVAPERPAAFCILDRVST